MADLLKLDLGCGKRKKEGFVGVDISAKSDADVVCDLRVTPWEIGEEAIVLKLMSVTKVGEARQPLTNQPTRGRNPLDDDSVDEVYSAHFLEHLTGHERMWFMNELHRVMKVGAKATIITPFYSSGRAIQDPTHAWPPICEMSYLYFNKRWRDENKLDHYPIVADFDFTCGYGLDSEVSLRAEEHQRFAVKHYINAVLDLQVVLTKRGADAPPG